MWDKITLLSDAEEIINNTYSVKSEFGIFNNVKVCENTHPRCLLVIEMFCLFLLLFFFGHAVHPKANSECSVSKSKNHFCNRK